MSAIKFIDVPKCLQWYINWFSFFEIENLFWIFHILPHDNTCMNIKIVKNFKVWNHSFFNFRFPLPAFDIGSYAHRNFVLLHYHDCMNNWNVLNLRYTNRYIIHSVKHHFQILWQFNLGKNLYKLNITVCDI